MNIKKIKKITVSILALFLIMLEPSCSLSKDQPKTGKVLVLGFSSNHVNSIQDRLLREMILRNLLAKGIPTVPVMELERYFIENDRDIQNIKDNALEGLCSEFKANFALKGAISKSGEKYIVEFMLYNISNKKIIRDKIIVDSSRLFNEYSPDLSKEISEKVGVIISGK